MSHLRSNVLSSLIPLKRAYRYVSSNARIDIVIHRVRLHVQKRYSAIVVDLGAAGVGDYSTIEALGTFSALPSFFRELMIFR